MTENETKKETETRKLFSIEKFKSKMHLQDLCPEKYEIRLNNVDWNMIAYFTANHENDICDNLIELWERDCKKGEEKSVKIFHGKEEGDWSTLLQVSAMQHKVWNKKRNLKIAETKKMIRKVETGTINRERRKKWYPFSKKK